MQLSSLLRPEQVKKYWRRTRASLEEELFKIYDADLKHQLYNGGSRGQVYLPVNYEGLNGDHVYENELAELFAAGVHSEAVASRVVDDLKGLGWKTESYVEDGCMVINLEV